MKKTTISTICALALLLGAVTAVSAAKINTLYDYGEALAAASESDKPVMIDFYFDT